MTFTRKTALTAACVAGLLSLTACAGGNNTEAFCDFVEDADSQFDTVELSPSNEAIAAAAGGDMSGINEWGDTSASNIDDVLDEVRAAESNAPTEDSAEALEVMARVISIMRDISDAAASSSDLDSFFEDAEAMYMEMDAEVLAAGDLDAPIDAAIAEHCA